MAKVKEKRRGKKNRLKNMNLNNKIELKIQLKNYKLFFYKKKSI